MITAYLLLGSNVGRREHYLGQARQEIKFWHRTKLVRASSVWETAPEGYLKQRRFFNQAVEIKTELSAMATLCWAKKSEIVIGRRRRFFQGPREIDIDLLFYGRQQLKSDMLTLPHAHFQDRIFALAAMVQLAPRMIIPGTRIMIQSAYKRLKKQSSPWAAVRVS